MNVFNSNLKAIKAARLGHLDLAGKAVHKVLIDNAVGRGKEGEHVGDEVALVSVELRVPVGL